MKGSFEFNVDGLMRLLYLLVKDSEARLNASIAIAVLSGYSGSLRFLDESDDNYVRIEELRDKLIKLLVLKLADLLDDDDDMRRLFDTLCNTFGVGMEICLKRTGEVIRVGVEPPDITDLQH